MMLHRICCQFFKRTTCATRYTKSTAQFSTSNARKTALVTGGNRGIGLQACKHLCDSGFNVIMTTRCLDRGNAALKRSFSEDRSDKISLLKLDINDPHSITDAVKHIEQNYDNIDILVNNAGVHYGYDDLKYSDLSKTEKINNTFATNYYGTVSLTHKILPFLKESRIICLSNRDSALWKLSPELRNEFLRDDLEENELDYLMERYKKDAIKGDHTGDKDVITTKLGWINSYYLMSYVGVNVFCRILGNKLKQIPEQTHWIGSYCPGHCATDSTDYFGNREPSESAFGIMTLSTMMLNEYTPNGSFWAAFFKSDDLDSGVELEIMDLIHPIDTVPWDILCDQFVSDPKIEAH